MNHVIKRLQDMLAMFFRITTGIIIVTALYIVMFWGKNSQIQVTILWQILMVSVFCSVGSLLLPCDSEKEVSKRGMLVRMILYFLYVNIVVMVSGFRFEWFDTSNGKMVFVMELCIIAVFAVVTAVSHFTDYKTAEQMNRKLREREE